MVAASSGHAAASKLYRIGVSEGCEFSNEKLVHPGRSDIRSQLRIHLTFFFLLIFVWLTESTTHGPANAGRGLALVGIIFGSVVLHELGHALVSMRAGIPAKAIILLPIGGVTLLDETQRPLEPGILTWKRDIRIALAGPGQYRHRRDRGQHAAGRSAPDSPLDEALRLLG